jgi:hypothetical protein
MPSETPQEYTARLISYTESKDAMEVLRTTAGRLRELMTGRWDQTLRQRPSAERWSAAEIVTHLADSEIVGAWRFRTVLAWNAAPLQPYDQNTWASLFRYAEADPWESLEMFDALRRTTVSLLARVDPALFDNYGVHAERGRESVHHLIRLYAGHDINHLRQVESLLPPA